MGTYEIDIFNETRKLYSILYKKETKELKRTHTTVYSNPIERSQLNYKPNPGMVVRVVNSGTVNTGRELAKNGKTAILNFADAITPGGLVLYGETTQEENICRCSNLYASLTTKKADKNYYTVNRLSHSGGIYTDTLIYSEDVLFFRDDITYKIVEPYKMDVITCPAPSIRIFNSDEEYRTLYHRIEKIVRSAVLHGVDNLVLGAWGCGAFGQNPVIVSSCFNEVVHRHKAFKNVIFAIRDCNADLYSGTSSNYRLFKTRILET